MSKKVISLALVVAMLFCMASMASAALGSEKKMGFTVSADKTTVAAGDTVEITVSAEAVAEAWGGGVIPVAYDNDAISLPAAATAGNTTAWSDYLTLSAAYGSIISAATTATEPYAYGDLTERTEDQGKNWDTGVMVAMAAATTTSLYTFNGVEEMFTLKFTVSENAKAGDKIYVGIPACAFDGDPPIGMMYSDDYGMEYWVDYDGDVYDFTDATVELTVGSAVEVTHVKQQSKWNGGNDKNTAENYLFGFVGQVSGLELTTEKVGERTMVTNIQSITATATYAGGTATSDVITVWAVDGGYQFRAQFKGFAPTDEKEVSVVFAITMNDGTTVYTSDAYGRAINDIYNASVVAGLPAVAA